MKIVVNCWNIKSFKSMVNLKVDKIRIGMKNYSIRFNDYFNLSDLKEIVKIKKNTRISIAINRFFDEKEIPNLISFLKKISKLNIDEISFSDLAICQIVNENKIKVNLHYNPETILTNYEQIWFFQKNKINSFTISNVLMKNEITEILKYKNKSILELQFFGQTFFMYSKWPLISNFQEYLKIKNQKLPKKKYYIIQEENRDVPNFIYEEKYGTSMYSGFILNLSKKINFFNENKLDFIFIESLFQNIIWLEKTVKIFQKIICGKISGEDGYLLLEKFNSKLINSESFLGDISKLPSFKRDEDE